MSMQRVHLSTLTEDEQDELRSGYYCSDCDEFHSDDEYDAEPSYECAACGAVFLRSESDYESHRCNCGKFASKKADDACPRCHEGMEEVQAIERDNEIMIVTNE
jgi:rubredoxin